MSRFVHLHTHSHYSFLEALPKVDELVDAAVAQGMDAVGLTDTGNMHGAIEFYKAAEKRGIKPILGVDLHMAPRSRFDKDPVHDAKYSRIVLLAENIAGYKNLLALVSKAHIEGFFERPRIDRELLREHKGGLIAIMPSFAGDVAKLLAAGDADGAAAALAEYMVIMGPDNLFLEITHHPKVPGHMDRMERIIEIGTRAKVPLLAQHDVYYVKPDDREATEVMRRIRYGSTSTGGNEDEDFSFVGVEDIDRWFGHVPGAVGASGDIAARCNVTFELGRWTFPNVPLGKGFKTHGDELRAKTYAGLETRNMEKTPEVEERIEYELNIIEGKGFARYFLVVSDLLNHAKEEGILTTTRGSAAGSIVSYLTGITNVDPIEYKLPFERFLNPERPKAPDIDMDMADNRRDDMIRYVKQKYGDENVAQIGTFGTLMARAAVRDVSRALGHSYGVGDRIAKLIPIGSQGFPMTIDKALEIEPDLKALYDEDEDAREVLQLARRIEGCVRHVGVHAAGVVISPTPLIEWTPLQPDPKGTGKLITQYDMYSITDEYGGVGLLKFDFLGIKNLSILSDAVARVKETLGTDIDIENVPLDDARTFAMLARGETEGTFQLNGSGMTRYLKELKPTTIHDINAMVALYRPGPMETIPAYIERKHNPALVNFIDDRMKEYLDTSYGLLVYQDDVLLTAITLGGYSWLEADTLRKAMGKKIPAEMAAQKEKLMEGFKEHGGLPPAKSEKIWKLIEPFAAYGFNKAHAACYGKVAYQTSYMKANYPVEYMAAVLTADSGDTDAIANFSAECERLRIPLLPPDVNESGTDFTVVPMEGNKAGAIRFGLSSIKNFGEGVSHAILDERVKNGPYATLSEFLSRVAAKSLNRKSLESLTKCGALDRFGDRTYLLDNIEMQLAFHRDATQAAAQESLFGAMAMAPTLHLPAASGQETSAADKLAWEKELLGIYVSGHPLDVHEETRMKATATIGGILAEPRPGFPVILPALITEVKTYLTKSGEKMAFVTFEDKTGSIEAVIFPKLYKEQARAVVSGTCVLIKGAVSIRNGETTLALENLKAL
ncbi:MAG: polymerase subunit alpha [Candidatus Parcubacteria bacterium]|jgi:DNA polymerase-3 subunit alpha|nr:polymerase subunit alpha [Candidatus Parcubacteria bacterium]